MKQPTKKPTLSTFCVTFQQALKPCLQLERSKDYNPIYCHVLWRNQKILMQITNFCKLFPKNSLSVNVFFLSPCSVLLGYTTEVHDTPTLKTQVDCLQLRLQQTQFNKEISFNHLKHSSHQGQEWIARKKARRAAEGSFAISISNMMQQRHSTTELLRPSLLNAFSNNPRILCCEPPLNISNDNAKSQRTTDGFLRMYHKRINYCLVDIRENLHKPNGHSKLPYVSFRGNREHV